MITGLQVSSQFFFSLLKWEYFFHQMLKNKTLHKRNSDSSQAEVNRLTTDGEDASRIQNKLVAIKLQAPRHLCCK